MEIIRTSSMTSVCNNEVPIISKINAVQLKIMRPTKKILIPVNKLSWSAEKCPLRHSETLLGPSDPTPMNNRLHEIAITV